MASMILAAVIRCPPRLLLALACRNVATGGRILIAPRAAGQGRNLSARNSGATGHRGGPHVGPWTSTCLGGDGELAGQFAPWADAGHRPGRVLAAHRGGDLVATAPGELLAQATGRLRHLAGPSVAGLPAVGDWVAVRDDRIHAALPRRTRA